MKPALSQVCSLSSPFESDIEDYASADCKAIELWFGKLEAYLEDHSIEKVREALGARGMAAPVASFQGGLFEDDGGAREEHWGHFRRRLVLCRDLGTGTLVIAGDIRDPFSPQRLDHVRHSLTEAARVAAEQGVRLAFEFQGRAPFVNNLQTAAALVAECDSPALGLCLDVFHFYVGPSKREDLFALSRDNLFHVQLCDLAGHPRELATDSDRVLPGDGDFLLTPLVDRLREIDYDGYVSIELMNPEIWAVPSLNFGEVGVRALDRVLSLSETN
jgi:4-hydroxyphenylpyruvate dioxygenase